MPAHDTTRTDQSQQPVSPGKKGIGFKPPAQFFFPGENEQPLAEAHTAEQKPALQLKSGTYFGGNVVQRAIWQYHGARRWVRVTNPAQVRLVPFPDDLTLYNFFDDQTGRVGMVVEAGQISLKENKDVEPAAVNYEEVLAPAAGPPAMAPGSAGGPAVSGLGLGLVPATPTPAPTGPVMVPDHTDHANTMVDASKWNWKQICAWQKWRTDLGTSDTTYQVHREKILTAFHALNRLAETPAIAKEKSDEKDAADLAEHLRRMKEDPKYKENYEFDEKVKGKRKTIDPGKAAAAKEMIAGFSGFAGVMQFGINDKGNEHRKQFVIDYLNGVIDNPEKLSQGDYPLCGPDTFLRMIVLSEPQLYVNYVIGLLTTGTGKIGNISVTVPSNIREKRVWAKTMKMPELVASGSLRSQKNTLYGDIRVDKHNWGARKWHAGISGMTRMGELTSWFAEMGLPADAISSNSYYMTADATDDTVKTINAAYAKGDVVALVVNPEVVGNVLDREIGTAYLYRHWVTLTSPIVPTSKNDHYRAQVMTYGKIENMLFLKRQLGKGLLGYVTVNMAKLAVAAEGKGKQG